jgi:hypothetical protein
MQLACLGGFEADLAEELADLAPGTGGEEDQVADLDVRASPRAAISASEKNLVIGDFQVPSSCTRM